MLERVELNEPRYLQLEERHGYLGYLAPIDAPEGGCLVRIVGNGTPAAIAGIQAGDVITRLGEIEIKDAAGYLETLLTTRPGQEVEITVRRKGANGQGGNEKQVLRATLVRMPAQVVRPEAATEPLQIVKRRAHDPLSLLFTLHEVDGKRIADDATELAGIRLRTGNWMGERIDERTVEFSREVTKHGLRVVKRFQIAKLMRPIPTRRITCTSMSELRIKATSRGSWHISLMGPMGCRSKAGGFFIRIGFQPSGSRRLRFATWHSDSKGEMRGWSAA